jgi:hypothetical protein
MDRQIVGIRAALDESNHLVAGWIDDVVDVAGVVALQDANGNPCIGIEPGHSLRRQRCRKNKEGDAD